MARRTPIDALLAPRVAALTNVMGAALAGEPEAVHQARVASRRLREVLPAFAAVGAAERDAKRAVRRVTRALGGVRELDVAIEHFEAAVAAHGLRPAVQATARRALHTARSAAWRQARTTLTKARVARLQTRLEALTTAAAGADGEAVTAVMRARVLRAATRLGKAVAQVSTVYAPGPLHEVRIAVKRLRYAVEAGGTWIGVRRASAQVRQLRAVQDLLGRAHDLHVLGGVLQQVQRRVVSRSRTMARELADLEHALDSECRTLQAAFLRRRAGLLSLSAAIASAAPPAAARSVA